MALANLSDWNSCEVITMSKYFSFQWHITDDCDRRCKHCYIFSEDNCKAVP